MARVLVLYATPPNPAAFDQHYADIHIPLAKKLPGLQNFDLSTGRIHSPAGPSAFHDADAQTLRAPGSQLLFFDTREA